MLSALEAGTTYEIRVVAYDGYSRFCSKIKVVRTEGFGEFYSIPHFMSATFVYILQSLPVSPLLSFVCSFIKFCYIQKLAFILLLVFVGKILLVFIKDAKFILGSKIDSLLTAFI